MNRIACPARVDPNGGDPCPVGGGLATFEHSHDPVILASAIRRNAAIDTACREFAAARDMLDKKFSRDRVGFVKAIAVWEQALDKAKDAAWSQFNKETSQ